MDFAVDAAFFHFFVKGLNPYLVSLLPYWKGPYLLYT